MFERMEAFAEVRDNVENKALSLIWQGHMLDLMGKRDQAVSRYRQVVKMNLTKSWMHTQYGMK